MMRRAMAQLGLSSLHSPVDACLASIGLFKRTHQIILFNFCSQVEKTELPSWTEQPQNVVTQSDDDEDFILPSQEAQKGSWVNVREFLDPKTDAKRPWNEKNETEVEKISKILKARHNSVESIHRGLDGCGVKVSEELVEQILKRFNNDWTSALGFFQWANSQADYKHTQQAYDIMVDILGKMKQFETMWAVIDEMKQLGGLISLRTFSKVMRRYAGAEKWKDAVRTFNELENFSVKMDTAAMNVLLDTLCKEQRVEHAWDIFLEFKDRIPPDAHTFNVLVHGWCKARRLEEAEWTMEEMRRNGFNPCVISYTSLIEAYCLERDFCKVDGLLDEMQEKDCPPNVITYTIVMHALGKAKETQEAFRVYDRMKANGCTPDVAFYNSLIFILGKAGRLKDAYGIFQEMSKNGLTPNVTTYNTMLAVICEHLQEENAFKFFREMEESNCKPDLQTYNPLLKMCCKLKRMKILSYLLDDMLNKDCSPDLGTYTLLIHGLCKVGRLDRACEFFEEMIEKRIIPKYITYALLLDELERRGKEGEKRRIQELRTKAENMKQLGRKSRMQIET
eukprot:Gb_10944 [translate_table: standard]